MSNFPSGPEQNVATQGKVLGAIIGAGAGFAFGSPLLALILALVGVVLGHTLDARNADALEGLRVREMPRSAEDLLGPAPEPIAPRAAAPALPSPRLHALETLCQLLVALAAADVEIDQEHVHAMRVLFDGALAATAEERGLIRLWLKAAIARPSAPDAIDLAPLEHFTPAGRLAIVGTLLDVAHALGRPQEWTERAIRTVARRLSVSEHEVRELFDRRAGDLTPHFTTLGLLPGISDEELKRAYRRLAREHHPDRFAHLGAAEVDRASERFRKIDLAYEAVRRARGL
jgi:DnaJ like chaperone protein